MALTEKLSAIGDAIREKTGGTELLKLDEMPAAIEGISGGASGYVPTDEDLTITGPQYYCFTYDRFKWLLDNYMNKITTKNLSYSERMFQNTTQKEIPLVFNFQTTRDNLSAFLFFAYSNDLEKVSGKITGKLNEFYSFFEGDYYLKEIRSDFFDLEPNTSSCNINSIFQKCYSLRKLPSLTFLYNLTTSDSSDSFYYNGFSECYCLEEINDLPVYIKKMTSNPFVDTFLNNSRLSTFTFDSGKEVNWKGFVITLSNYVGYISSSNIKYILNYNSGITADKQVTDDATYQALKNDPDWFTANIAYSRYNHDSAVETINSLPDTSAYLATAGGTNTIKFRGASGSKTDGGAINTLTEEEIAVATAKGWTVSFV